jgi:hypothetical protein
MSDDELTDAAARFEHAFTPDDAARHPAYGHLARALAASPVACELLTRVPVEHRNPMLIFAALHFEALGGREPLAGLYRTLGTDDPVDPAHFATVVVNTIESDPGLVAAHLDRRTQTNEVGRSGVLRAVLNVLHARGLESCDLLDVGASAGLNLYLDHYDVAANASNDPLTITCDAHGRERFAPLPAIGSRVGLDQNPLDIHNPDDARWLKACLWPEDPVRLRRLGAIEERVASWEPITLVTGTATDALDAAIARTSGERPLVVWHTWAIAYLTPDDQRAFAARMRELVATGRCTWISIEWPRAVEALTLPSPTTPSPSVGNCQVVVAEAGDEPRHWGWCHHHGRWVSLDVPLGPKA